MRTLADLTAEEAIEVAKLANLPGFSDSRFDAKLTLVGWRITDWSGYQITITSKPFGIHALTNGGFNRYPTTTGIIRAYLYLKSTGIDVPLD